MADFISLASKCKAVIACRVSPDQKRQIVTMIRLHSGQKTPPMTLAIGDGANDVPMIMEAHVGVGISGNEGMQAVRSADYAIAQFRFLEALTLVHGRNNYKRISIVVMYSLYKNAFFVTTLFYYGIFTGFTGTALYDSLMFSGFNVMWASIGILVFGVIDRDISTSASLGCPQLYSDGQENSDFNLKVLLKWFVTALVHAAICFFLIAYTYWGKVVREGDDGLSPFGTVILQALVISVNLKLTLVSSILPNVTIASYLFGVIMFMLIGTIHSLWQFSSIMNRGYEYYDTFPAFFSSAAPWLCQILVIVTLFIPDIVFEFCRRTYLPKNSDIVRELDVGCGDGLKAFLHSQGRGEDKKHSRKSV
mmetsp:Transcript_44480/g.65162  ORF Transcript_44480/g.65162 Transcript_44480/m.65162 type:complete len:363 (+) Transcript_44480:132-1220(+)